MNRRRAWLTLALAVALPAAAQSEWQSLPEAERAVLAPWATRWDALDAAQRERLRRNTQHWLGLDRAQRAALEARLAAWDALPPAQRTRIREHAAAWEKMDEGQRAALRASRMRLQAMAPMERAALHVGFEQLGSSERRTLLVTEDALALAQIAQQAFAFVPPEERAATLDMLRTLPPADRLRLATLARRIGPEQRAELRKDLLATPREERAAYLRRRMEPE